MPVSIPVVLRFSVLAWVGQLSAACLALGCDLNLLEDPPPAPYLVRFKVESDPGQPMPGAEIMYKDKVIKKTDDKGTAMLKLRGADGKRYVLKVRCPEGFQSPDEDTVVTLRRLADNRAAEYSIECPPSVRSAVVVIRAEKGGDLPVNYLGKEVARTDASGIAHVLMQLKPGSRFDLTLDTSVNEKIEEPLNPVKSFIVGDHDEIFMFNEAFKFKKPKKKKIWRKPVDEGPKPL